MSFFVLLFTALFSYTTLATGLNFWESSPVNSALASANGAYATDAGILALAPASMAWLNSATITANATHYQVDTDYDILGMQSAYSKSDPIPAGFFTLPIKENWHLGLAVYSRTAADISIPQITIFFPETRVRPIVVSLAPSLAYQHGNFSFALSAEYQNAEYLLEQNLCNFFGHCERKEIKDNVDGWSGAISLSWRPNDKLSLAAAHRLASQFKDENIAFDLPSITSLYATVSFFESLHWHSSMSYSNWNKKGIKYSEYSDFIGLLKGFKNSKRFATSFEYGVGNLSLMAGLSMDEAIDAFGGDDFRYRLGLGYQFTPHLRVDIAAFKEQYSRKFVDSSIGSVDVQNSGYGIGLGASYRF